MPAWYKANREEFLARRRARYHSDPDARERQLKAAQRWKTEHPKESTGPVRKINGTVTPVLRISAVAKILKRTVLTLRQWEQKGWVPAANQAEGQHRVYTQHQVQLMGQLVAFLDQHSYVLRHDEKVRLQLNELVKEIKEPWDECTVPGASDDAKPGSV